jgi:membrane protein DedA with SNARE-associated domain
LNYLGDIAQWSVEVVYSFGYLGVAVLMAMSNLFVPIPSELVLPFAGYLVGQGRFSLLPVLVASTAGSVTSALILYALGRWLGEESLRRFVRRFGRYLFVSESGLDKASSWFGRHGWEAVLIVRLLPGVGNLISVPAGIERMPVRWFVAYTGLGNGLWNSLFICFGWALGAQWTFVEYEYARLAKYVVLAAIVGSILWFVWHRWTAHHR